MKTTGKKVIIRVLGLTYATVYGHIHQKILCPDSHSNIMPIAKIQYVYGLMFLE